MTVAIRDAETLPCVLPSPCCSQLLQKLSHCSMVHTASPPLYCWSASLSLKYSFCPTLTPLWDSKIPSSQNGRVPGWPHSTPTPCMCLRRRKASLRQRQAASLWTKLWQAVGFRGKADKGHCSWVSLLPVPMPGTQSCCGCGQHVLWPHVPSSAQSQGKRCPTVMQVEHSSAPSSDP